MSYLKTIGIDTLTLPSDPTFQVRMRSRATYGMTRGAQSQMMRVEEDPTSQTGTTAKADWGAYIGKLVFDLLVDWTLTDENDLPLSLTMANLDKLDPEDGQFLSDEASKRAKLRGVVQERPFGKPPLTPSPVTT